MKQIYREIIWGGETWESGAQNRIIFLAIFVLVFFSFVAVVPWVVNFKMALIDIGKPILLGGVAATFITIFAGKTIDTPEVPYD